jgi:hypothetical protein
MSNEPRVARLSKNQITFEQIQLACGHVLELNAAGVTSNIAIRTLELMIDVYGKLYHGGKATPHHVSHIKQWSIAARKAIVNHPGRPAKEFLRVEHGTPRRALATLVLKHHADNSLDKNLLNDFMARYWKLAVLTLEEDERLNRLVRSKMSDTPEQRWALVNIEMEEST